MPASSPRQRLSRILGAAALVLAPALGGCLMGAGAGPGALPAVVSMLDLTAYPGARFISQETNSDNVGFVQRPGRHGSRVYETLDEPELVRAHYERFAKANGWSLSSQPDDWTPSSYGSIATLQKGEFYVSVQPDHAYGGYGYGPGYTPPTPEPTPDYWGSPDPTATPFTGPTPTPTASAKPLPFRFRVSVSMQ